MAKAKPTPQPAVEPVVETETVDGDELDLVWGTGGDGDDQEAMDNAHEKALVDLLSDQDDQEPLFGAVVDGTDAESENDVETDVNNETTQDQAETAEPVVVETPPVVADVADKPAGKPDRPTAAHQEAAWVAWTQQTVGGVPWTLTLRQGMTRRDVDSMLGAVDYVNAMLAARRDDDQQAQAGNGGQRQTPTAAPAWGGGGTDRPTPPFGPQKAAQSVVGAPTAQAQLGGSERIGRVEIGGTKDDPTVQMYSSNLNLKFPILQPKARFVTEVIRRRYGGTIDQEQLDLLQQCGSVIPVSWEVSWTPSPKNPKWKDLVDIEFK